MYVIGTQNNRTKRITGARHDAMLQGSITKINGLQVLLNLCIVPKSAED